MTHQTLVLTALLALLTACNHPMAEERIANCQAQGSSRDECTNTDDALKDDIQSTISPSEPQNMHGVRKLQETAAP